MFYFEVITGNIRLKERAKGERVNEKGKRPKTTPWETLESGCGKKTRGAEELGQNYAPGAVRGEVFTRTEESAFAC